MSAKKTTSCKVCQTVFTARRGAKTCSPNCRKRLQRFVQAQEASKTARLEAAVGQEFHRLAAGLLRKHVLFTPLALADERGAVLAPSLEPETTFEPSAPVIKPS